MDRWPDSWKEWWRRLGLLGGAGAEQGGESKPPDKSSRTWRLALLIVIGAGLMLLGNLRGTEEKEAVGSPAFPTNGGAALVQANYDGYVDELERQISLAVTQIAGVGNAVVMIVPKTSEVSVLAEEVTERESQSTGADEREGSVRYERSVTRRPITVTGEDGRRQEPVLLYTRNPEIAGALVVADGARDPRVQLLIVRAVSTALGIPPHKVEVVPKKM